MENPPTEIEIIDTEVPMDVDKKNGNNFENFIYFKIEDFLVRKKAIDDILSNKWLTDNELMAFAKCIV
ncbi:hypothetical protein BpHYR1_002269, partial [Brachionus plicatilis]